jgi:hypothetical protein
MSLVLKKQTGAHLCLDTGPEGAEIPRSKRLIVQNSLRRRKESSPKYVEWCLIYYCSYE